MRILPQLLCELALQVFLDTTTNEGARRFAVFEKPALSGAEGAGIATACDVSFRVFSSERHRSWFPPFRTERERMGHPLLRWRKRVGHPPYRAKCEEVGHTTAPTRAAEVRIDRSSNDGVESCETSSGPSTFQGAVK